MASYKVETNSLLTVPLITVFKKHQLFINTGTRSNFCIILSPHMLKLLVALYTRIYSLRKLVNRRIESRTDLSIRQ